MVLAVSYIKCFIRPFSTLRENQFPFEIFRCAAAHYTTTQSFLTVCDLRQGHERAFQPKKRSAFAEGQKKSVYSFDYRLPKAGSEKSIRSSDKLVISKLKTVKAQKCAHVHM